MAGQYAVAADLESHIKATLNAAATWGGAIAKKIYSDAEITNARREASYEVLQSISRNPKEGYFMDLAVYVAVPDPATQIDANQGPLPPHDGEPGVPLIVPFFGARARTGIPADADQIDTWVNEQATTPSSTGASDGTAKPHSVSDSQGRPSPVACRFNITDNLFKFTGFAAQIPMMQITVAMADNKIPIGVGPVVWKLSIPKLMKPGDNLYVIAPALGNEGRLDLVSIEKGQMAVKPVRSVPEIVASLKSGQ